MTIKEHLERAEYLLGQCSNENSPWPPDWVLAKALEAQAHVLIAIATELGAPHAAGPGTEASSGQRPGG